ncbi:3-oxoadipate enol-lactonase [Bosea sp. BE125]|uniref:alpha/beta fold hydrolase n=1 Tax=Bosea sp. BE125 TaxID=2817909 RepID=UPI00285DFC9F|nr:alpha/beta hydrolase [Bosea sp. BE125]MDR6873197.1 3-oxoadipate enol-lactonase [Bosea sp. BE125]
MPVASLGSCELRYEISGEGPDLVLIHELGGALDSFDGLLPLLTPHFRVLRYDQRGAGGSSRKPAALSMEDHAADLAGLVAMTGFGPRCLLAGAAAGAAIAVAYAARDEALVDALALCAPALSVRPERKAYLDRRARLARRDGMAAIAEASLARSYPEALRTDRRAFEAYRERFLANDPESYAMANAVLAGTRVAKCLPSLTMPCLVLAGRHDLLRPPAEVEATAGTIPDARFTTIESGHLMPVQAAQAMAAQLVPFLTRHAGSHKPIAESAHV